MIKSEIYEELFKDLHRMQQRLATELGVPLDIVVRCGSAVHHKNTTEPMIERTYAAPSVNMRVLITERESLQHGILATSREQDTVWMADFKK